jgi:hypothetical protein
MAQYLYRRAGRYYFRLRIPADIRHHFGDRREIRKSLNTYNRRVALIKAWRLMEEMTRKSFLPPFEYPINSESLRETKEKVCHYIDIRHPDLEEEYVRIDTGDPDKDAEIAQRLLNGTLKSSTSELLADVIVEFCQEKSTSGE